MSSGSYLLVTPAHDELDLLHDLVTTVRSQELPPKLWVLVDDGSSDGTGEALDELASRESWVHVTHLRPRAERTSTRYAEVIGAAFRAAAELAEAEGIDYDYVINLDADVRCPPPLLAELVARAEGDRLVGIASCTLAEVDEDGDARPAGEEPLGGPRGGLRLWRRACLEEIAFYPTQHWAGVTNIRARNRGWKTVVHQDLEAEVVRADASREGWWSGYRQRGEAVWHVGLHPMLVAAEAVRVSAKERDLRGLAYLAGWVESAVKKRGRSHDPEVREYFGRDLPRQQLQSLVRWLPHRRGR